MTDHRALAIVGPTAAGKTDLCLELVEQLDGELISMDSAQVYRGMDIGTAKPSPDERQRFPHHLIDIRDFDEPYSAAEFAQDAAVAIRAIKSRDRTAIVSGGTMLYWKALSEGLSDLPEADPAVRDALVREASDRGWPALHGDLWRVDPDLAKRVQPGDAQRIQRALEVYRQTGTPLSQLQKRRRRMIDLNALVIIVHPADRAVLHQRIESRLNVMFAGGLVDEVRRFYNDPRFDPNLPSMRSVGYRQVIDGFTSESSEREMRDRTLFATRQLAKRQVTWLRSIPAAVWIDPSSTQEISRAKAAIARFFDDKL